MKGADLWLWKIKCTKTMIFFKIRIWVHIKIITKTVIAQRCKYKFYPNEVARIRSAFSLISAFLGKENKRYVVSKISGKGAKDADKDALDYLKDTGRDQRRKINSYLHIPCKDLKH